MRKILSAQSSQTRAWFGSRRRVIRCSSSLEIARWLEDRREIKSVHYPGLKSHPQHDLARQQMRGFGGMVTIVLKTDLAGTRRFLENTHLFALAESLGGVESLINHPALMTLSLIH